VTAEHPRILVTDDSPVIRELIVINLELEGFEVSQACDGRECLEVVEKVAPDAITLDVAMPGLDGFTTAARLKANPATAGIPIVMVTARAQAADLLRGEEIGVDAYITKPFDPGNLVATLRSVIPAA
jgi:DNA-binding response OmpR family regulator